MVINLDDRCSMKVVREEIKRILDKSQDADGAKSLLGQPQSRFPLTPPKSDRHGMLPVGSPPESKLSMGALSKLSSDRKELEVRGFRGEDDVKPQEQDDDPSVSSQTPSIRGIKSGRNANSGGSEDHDQHDSQRSDGNTGEIQRSPSVESNISGTMRQEGRTSRLARLGRLIPSNIRNRFRS